MARVPPSQKPAARMANVSMLFAFSGYKIVLGSVPAFVRRSSSSPTLLMRVESSVQSNPHATPIDASRLLFAP